MEKLKTSLAPVEYKFKWPAGYRSAAVFTFDVDGASNQQLMEGTTLGNLSAGEYGPRVAVPRILKLLEKYNLKGTFFVPAWVAEHYPALIREIHGRGHEIGAHGYLHENFGRLSAEEETVIHDRSLRILTEIVGERPRSFRCPGGPLSDRTVRNLYSRGYNCDSSSVSDYLPSRVKLDGREVEMVEIPWSWLTDDFGYFWGGAHVSAFGGASQTVFCALSAPGDIVDYWIAEFDGIHNFGGLFTCLNHPRAIGRVSRLRALEKLITHIKATPGVWITSMAEVVDWVLKN
jgi:peptidoglycan-N-acetylglucosamine deacetylase